jgi:hypothetical protein
MIAMKSVRLATVVFAGTLVAMAGSAFAETSWERNHPRRDHREDRQVRREERTMASLDGGHITRADQRALNQQENAISRQIGR